MARGAFRHLGARRMRPDDDRAGTDAGPVLSTRQRAGHAQRYDVGGWRDRVSPERSIENLEAADDGMIAIARISARPIICYYTGTNPSA
jgi:hypothetical protein